MAYLVNGIVVQLFTRVPLTLYKFGEATSQTHERESALN